MRALLVIATILLISPYGRAQQPAAGRGGGGGRGQQAAPPAPPANPGFECFDRVETPEFPAAALQTHVDGTAWLSIHLTPQSTVDKIDTQISSAWTSGARDA